MAFSLSLSLFLGIVLTKLIIACRLESKSVLEDGFLDSLELTTTDNPLDPFKVLDDYLKENSLPELFVRQSLKINGLIMAQSILYSNRPSKKVMPVRDRI
jgi:hypothetical protein